MNAVRDPLHVYSGLCATTDSCCTAHQKRERAGILTVGSKLQGLGPAVAKTMWPGLLQRLVQ